MMLYLFIINFFAPYQQPIIPWQPIRYQTLYTSGDFKAKKFHNPCINYLPHDNSVLLVNDIGYADEAAPNKIGIVARKGYINFRNNGSSNIDWLNPVSITDPNAISSDYNPSVVVDQKTGTIICIWNGNKDFESSTPEDPAHVYFSKSTDDGFTWTPKQDITSQLYSSLCPTCTDEQKKWQAMNISSGTGLQLKDGRIIFPVVIKYNFPYGKTKNFFVISDDLGKSWFCTTDGPVTNVIQAKAVELNNHHVLLVIGQNGTTKMVYSTNRAENWVNFGSFQDLANGNSNIGLTRFTSTIDGYNKNRLLLTMPNNNDGKFEKLHIFVSYDEGSSWAYNHVIEWGASAYSSIATTPNGDILVFYEKLGPTPYDLVVANFSLDYLTDGADTYVKPEKLRWCLSTERTALVGQLCPKGAYMIEYKLFDNQIESFPIYADDFQVGFIDAFRDFTIDLSRGGMRTATISNYNSTRIAITFSGSSTARREITLKGNIDVFITRENLDHIQFALDDTVKVNLIQPQSKASLLEKATNANKKKQIVVPFNIVMLISTALFVVGLLIVFAVNHAFLAKKILKMIIHHF